VNDGYRVSMLRFAVNSPTEIHIFSRNLRGARIMEYRYLGTSGFKVPALGFGAGTFGGKGPLFSAWGRTDAAEATRLVDICLDAGVNLFDTADVYSDGQSETILGAAIAGRRSQVILSTKLTLRTGEGPNDVGASRYHLIEATHKALERLGTDYIDLLQLHHFDAMTPVEQVMSTLDDLVRSGKVRYLGVSNFSAWHLTDAAGSGPRRGSGGLESARLGPPDRQDSSRTAAAEP
jgi:aryl-alcohol dehydrogenase-like predicted oxidoreductase